MVMKNKLGITTSAELARVEEKLTKKAAKQLYDTELNPVSWSNFQNLWGFTMFSKEVQIEAVTMYLQGIPPYKIREKFGIKGTDTIRNWVTNIKELGVYGLNNASQDRKSVV